MKSNANAAAEFSSGKWKNARRSTSVARRWIESRSRQRLGLSLRDALDGEVLHRFFEQPMEIEFGAQMQEHAAETNRRTIHQHELAWNSDRSLFPQQLLDAECFAPAVLARLDAVSDRADAI